MIRKKLPEIARKIRTARQDAGMTRYALAKAAGISSNGLKAIEEAEASPSVATLEKLAAALGGKLAIEFEIPAAEKTKG